MGQHVTRRVHDGDGGVLVGDSDVDVHSENQQCARRLLQLLDQLLVSFIGRDLLILPVRDRVGGGGYNGEPFAVCQLGDGAAQANDIGSTFFDVAADAGSNLDHRLVHFRLDLLAEDHPTLVEHFIHPGAQLTGVRVDDLKLFLDADREIVVEWHGVAMVSRSP